eukprot:CAMPEP_0113672598 /NCGR_PEP_ID=MMETSP0038_2-20120614/6362_1 /TAXON_ID=2898 /ORGANISM="Cryptomonas paramecium" /LENGTH=207 /DNA_ID=CAMNT_0000588905 /DNA_START=243 /DNA_END=863 /DNA_ORIENTATION=+ /assembly_acc=CAM_ASM_000170
MKMGMSFRELKEWLTSTVFEMMLVLIFLFFCNYMKADIKYLVNFFLSSFVCPMITIAFPQPNIGPTWKGRPLWNETWGETLVHAFIAAGLVTTWLYQGMDQLFLGFLFLLDPMLQERFMTSFRKMGIFVSAVMLLSLPWLAIGVAYRFFPVYSEQIPKSFLQGLLVLANATPNIPDFFAVLGVSPDTDLKTIKRISRTKSLALHPDK